MPKVYHESTRNLVNLIFLCVAVQFNPRSVSAGRSIISKRIEANFPRKSMAKLLGKRQSFHFEQTMIESVRVSLFAASVLKTWAIETLSEIFCSFNGCIRLIDGRTMHPLTRKIVVLRTKMKRQWYRKSILRFSTVQTM